jgi:hypothetical protein
MKDASKFRITIQETSDHWTWNVFHATDRRNSAAWGPSNSEQLAKESAEDWVRKYRIKMERLANLKPEYSYEV